jgi:hypothetical protein
VCLKERNLLATQLQWHKGKSSADAYKERHHKVGVGVWGVGEESREDGEC